MSFLTIDTMEWLIAALRQGLEGQKGEGPEGQEGYQCDRGGRSGFLQELLPSVFRPTPRSLGC